MGGILEGNLVILIWGLLRRIELLNVLWGVIFIFSRSRSIPF